MIDNRPKPAILCVLDGWGYRKDRDSNAILQAHTPNWDKMLEECPSSLIEASELYVGLPEGQMGNSEVGHMNLGAGRVILQDLVRIDRAFSDGHVATQPKLLEFIAVLRKNNGICHLIGLLSPGGVHSHQNHIFALAEILDKAGIQVALHALLDGRDTPPSSAKEYLKETMAKIAPLQRTNMATICGRYFAMDRDNRWDRVERTYDAFMGKADYRAKDPMTALEEAYARGETDEFVKPTLIGDFDGMKDGDGILMANFRADRVREILSALLDSQFTHFKRQRRPNFATALGMVEYSSALNALIPALFEAEEIKDTLGEWIAKAGLRQLRIAETEKYAHVTFFFNGGEEQLFPGEERILVPSPKVATYDLKPEMSANEVTDRLVAAIESDAFDFVVVNYANTDMVGHSGNLKAAIKAVETIDHCLGRVRAATAKKGGVLLITADHGNAEMMKDVATGETHTAHTLNPVPFVLVGKNIAVRNGCLADIAPTILELMNLEKPKSMTGSSLLQLDKKLDTKDYRLRVAI